MRWIFYNRSNQIHDNNLNDMIAASACCTSFFYYITGSVNLVLRTGDGIFAVIPVPS